MAAIASCETPAAAQSLPGTAAGAGHGLRVHVRAVRRLATDVIELVLEPEGGVAAPYEAGAHLRLRLAGGLERSYSLCPGGDGRYVIAVKREENSRGGSAAVHALRVGDSLGFEGPFNAFALDWREKRLMLIAGGIGITPIYAMADEAWRRGHPFELHYFVRSHEHAAYAQVLRDAPYAAHVHLHVGLEADAVHRTLSDMAARTKVDDGAYVCGPRPLIDLARSLFEPLLGREHTHWESFGGALTPVPQRIEEATNEGAFELRLASGEGPFAVPPGCSALQVLLDAGIDVPHSCREGECGMCVVDVVEGTPEHRDRFLSDEVRASGQCMALCVSRARTATIVVDF